MPCIGQHTTKIRQICRNDEFGVSFRQYYENKTNIIAIIGAEYGNVFYI